MLDRTHPSPPTEVGRLLAYADGEQAGLVAALTAAHPHSGLVVRGASAVAAIRRLPRGLRRQPIVVDVAAWTSSVASEQSPLNLPPPNGMFGVSLDDWVSGLVASGAGTVLTPSGFVADGDWPALRAVLRAGARATRPDVATLVATDGAMLRRDRRSSFFRNLDEHVGDRPLAFVFAAPSNPVASRDRMSGLRELVARYPGCLLVATDAVVGCDAAARGVSAAIGVTSGLRRPTRPGESSGGYSNGYAPGLFLRELWEFRSPTTYADWYADTPSPTCADCGGRALDTFTADPADKQAILRHNVHAWLAVLDEITARDPLAAQAWLDADRRRALSAHLGLRPGAGVVSADRALRSLCEIDDLRQRRTNVTGQWI